MFATLRSTIVEHGSTFDAGALTAAEAVVALDDVDVMCRVLESMRAAVMKQIDDTAAYVGSGALDAARYCASKCALGVMEVRRTIDAEDKLAALPATASAARSGQLSTKATQMIARTASVNPAAEPSLLATASEGLSRLRASCVKARAEVEDPDDRADHQRKTRRHVGMDRRRRHGCG